MPTERFTPPITEVTMHTEYGEFGYGQNIYSEFFEDPSYDYLPNTIMYLSYRVMNDSAYYIEKFVTSDKNRFTKIELKWNYVKDAKIYAIYKGNSETTLSLFSYSEENVWYDMSPVESGFFYQVRPLFEEV